MMMLNPPRIEYIYSYFRLSAARALGRKYTRIITIITKNGTQSFVDACPLQQPLMVNKLLLAAPNPIQFRGYGLEVGCSRRFLLWVQEVPGSIPGSRQAKYYGHTLFGSMIYNHTNYTLVYLYKCFDINHTSTNTVINSVATHQIYMLLVLDNSVTIANL
jgi:hypothetical protein